MDAKVTETFGPHSMTRTAGQKRKARGDEATSEMFVYPDTSLSARAAVSRDQRRVSFGSPPAMGNTSSSRETSSRRLSFGCLPRTMATVNVPTTPLIPTATAVAVAVSGSGGYDDSNLEESSSLMTAKMIQTPASMTPMLNPIGRGLATGYNWHSAGKSVVKARPELCFPKDGKGDENMIDFGSSTNSNTSSSHSSNKTDTGGAAARNGSKDKSMGVLAINFMTTYQGRPVGIIIDCDDAVTELGTERRRIYDLFNVLESIGLVRKLKKKLTYEWLGTNDLPSVLGKVQAKAIARYPYDAQWFLGHQVESTDFIKKVPDSWKGNPAALPGQNGSDDSRSASPSIPNGKAKKEDKSIRKLSHDFLQVFLVGHQTLSLLEASEKMHHPGPSSVSLSIESTRDDKVSYSAETSRKQKAKIRRLYDLANILVSVGLLQKIEADGKLSVTRRLDYTWNYKYTPQDLHALYNHKERAGK